MQISRLFQMVYILLENGTVTAKELAERFEVSVRTVYRDVEALSQAEGSWRLGRLLPSGNFQLPGQF
jgi:DeoR/GlpR family transcriptional regulator of sugar metabolism